MVRLIHVGDCLEVLKTLPEKSVQTCVTSPPYWGLRDYGVDGQLGLEKTPDEYVAKMVAVFREVRRVLKDDGTLWLNLGDSYAGNGAFSQSATDADIRHATVGALLDKAQRRVGGVNGLKPKDLVGIPWRVAFALQADGWWLRQDIIWHKPNPMPESVTDRCTKAHEYIFLLSKAERYFYDADAVKEKATQSTIEQCKYTRLTEKGMNGFAKGYNTPDPAHEESHRKRQIEHGNRNRRSVWTVSTRPFKEAHFATYPPQLIEPCILAGSKAGDTVLDPFNGAGTTGIVAYRHGREYIGIELNPEYAEIATRRIENEKQKTALLK